MVLGIHFLHTHKVLRPNTTTALFIIQEGCVAVEPDLAGTLQTPPLMQYFPSAMAPILSLKYRFELFRSRYAQHLKRISGRQVRYVVVSSYSHNIQTQPLLSNMSPLCVYQPRVIERDCRSSPDGCLTHKQINDAYDTQRTYMTTPQLLCCQNALPHCAPESDPQRCRVLG